MEKSKDKSSEKDLDYYLDDVLRVLNAKPLFDIKK